MQRFFILFFFFAFAANAGTMARVVRVVDARTIVVARDGSQVSVRLIGVDPQPADEPEAKRLLEQTVAGVWVLVESQPRLGPDAAYVYRSPDGALVNEIVSRQFTAVESTHPMRILGEAEPGPRAAGRAAVTRTTTRTPTPRVHHRVPRRRMH